MTAPTLACTPATPTSVAAAVARLSPADPGAAVMHLLTPVGTLPRVDTGTGAGPSWRGVHLPWRPGGVLADIAAALAVVNAGRRDGDRFLTLEGDPCSWVDVVPSGSGHVVAGMVELFAGPPTSITPCVDAGQAYGFAVAAASAWTAAPVQWPMPLAVDGHVAWWDRSDHGTVISSGGGADVAELTASQARRWAELAVTRLSAHLGGAVVWLGAGTGGDFGTRVYPLSVHTQGQSWSTLLRVGAGFYQFEFPDARAFLGPDRLPACAA